MYVSVCVYLLIDGWKKGKAVHLCLENCIYFPVVRSVRNNYANTNYKLNDRGFNVHFY